MSQFKNIFVLLLISLSIDISSAQSNNFDLKIDESIKQITIEEDKKSGIKDIYIGSKVIEENGIYYLKESRNTDCKLESDYNSENSPYAKEFNLTQSTFKLFAKKINYLICRTSIFNKENDVVLTILKSPKVKNEHVVILIVARVDGLDSETINYAMENKWGKSTKEIKNDPKSNKEICLEMAPYELWGDKQLNKCIKKLNDTPFLKSINPSNSRTLLFENKNNFAELTHFSRYSQLIIQNKKTDLIVENISEIFQNYDNELKLSRQKNSSKDF